jgi:hypothetical protein
MIDILRIAAPLTLWLASFSAIYGLEGAVCSDTRVAAALGDRAILLAAALAGAVLQVCVLLALRSPGWASHSAFVRRLSVTLAATALVAALWTFMPVAATSLCL